MALELSVFLGQIKTAKTVIDIISMALKEEGTWIRQVADAHRSSAMQAIEAAKKGNYEQHMRITLGHLRDVYNLLAVTTKKEPSFFQQLFGGFSGEQAYITRMSETAQEMIEVAVLIAKGHSDLQEKDNAKDWAKRALATFPLYEKHELERGIYRISCNDGSGPVGAVDVDPVLKEARKKEVIASRLQLEKTLNLLL